MITVQTDHPLAADTVDHLHPRGTKNDSSIEPEFNRRLLAHFPWKPMVLDLGCAGGGFVGSLIEDGCLAAGIEGSDYSRRLGRAEWDIRRPAAPFLFTADITEPFQVAVQGCDHVYFDVITAWEVLEHIPEDRLAAVAENIRRHLFPGGLFIGSIAACSDLFEGVEYHATQRPHGWWTAWLESEGFTVDYDLIAYFDGAWVRGPNKGEVSSLCVVCRLSR